jgi:cytochrome c6
MRKAGIAGFCLVMTAVFIAPNMVAQEGGSGADTFKTKCATCHAADGSGNTPVGKSLKAADLRTPEVQKKTDAELADFVNTGKGNMPPFRNVITDDEIHSVVTYVRTLAPKTAKKPGKKS